MFLYLVLSHINGIKYRSVVIFLKINKILKTKSAWILGRRIHQSPGSHAGLLQQPKCKQEI
jgi:hypothetical protein